MPKKLTYRFVKESFEEEGYTLISKEYVNAGGKLEYECKFGHRGSIIWRNWYQGNRCEKCSNENKKLNINFVRTSFEAENYILLSTVYRGALSKLKYKCNNGHIGFMRWSDWQQGCRCRVCFIEKKRVGIDNVRESFDKEGYVLLTNAYVNNRTKLKYICLNRHENTTTWFAWKQGYRCPDCNKITIDKVRDNFEKEEYTLLSGVYINAHEKLKYKCPLGHEHSIAWSNWQQGIRCPVCAIINNSGPNCSSWKGGISCEPYCDVWTDKEYKQSIRERDGYRCLNPDCWKKDCKDGVLSIHHVDYNKKSCGPKNLITVCRSCNARANKDRKWHKDWYQAILNKRYGYKYESSKVAGR